MSDARSEDGSMDESTSTDSTLPTNETSSQGVPPIAAVNDSPVLPGVEANQAPKGFKLGRFVIATAPKPVNVPKPAKAPKAESAAQTSNDGAKVPPVTPLATSIEAMKSRRKFMTIVVALVVVGGLLLLINVNKSKDLSSLTGNVALSASELHDLVVAKHITVYWAGSMDGAKYTLTANTPGVAVVKYLPGGVGLNDTKTLFRAIGTYGQKNAYQIAKNSGASPGNVGFINADGNAIFYSSSRPTNVYIGIKGKDTQVEVFDPVVDQALGLVLVRNQIRLVA